MNLLFLNILHILNDGFESSFLLLLPFIAKDLHINLAQVGMLGTTNNIVELFVAFPSAIFAKKIGGLQTLIIALLIYTIGYATTGIAPSFLFLFITFLISGIGFGLFHSIAFALISKWSDPKKRGLHIGNFSAIGDVGRIAVSTLLTIIIAFLGWRKTVFVYAGISFLVFLGLIKFILKTKDNVETKKYIYKNISIMEIMRHKPFIFANLTNMLDTFASSSLFIFLPFLLLKRGINPTVLGGFTAIFFIGNFLGKTLIGRLSDRFGNTRMFIFSEILMAIMIVVIANVPSFIAISIASLALGIFTKGTIPVVKTMVSEASEHHGNFEKAFSLNSIVSTSAVTLAPITLGIISNKFGIISAFNVSAIFAILAIIPAALYKKNKKFT